MPRTLPFLLVALALAGCRGGVSDQPPIHLMKNMDQQSRFEPQEPNAFFKDKRGMRQWPTGTVPRGALHADDHLWRGRVEGDFAATLPTADADGVPMKLDRTLLVRGRQRFNIYCAPCHDAGGTGAGIVVKRGMMKPPSLHEERVLGFPVGKLYDIVTNGVRNMPPYRSQIGLRDRWAIAAYVRALQVSRSATLELVPPDKAAGQRWEIR